MTRSGECRFPYLESDFGREVWEEVEGHFGCIWRYTNSKVEGENSFENILGGKLTFLSCRYAGTTFLGEEEIAVCDFGIPAHLR